MSRTHFSSRALSQAAEPGSVAPPRDGVVVPDRERPGMASPDVPSQLEGFGPEDFAVFDVADFAGRMALIRHRLKPKLTALGSALRAPLSEAAGQPLFPHVAQHLRRTVNPPPETWVAFSRSARSYKPFVHYRVGISGHGVRVVCFLEDEAEDKPRYAVALARCARDFSLYFRHHAAIRAYDICDANGQPLTGRALTAASLKRLADRLKRVRAQHAVFGIAYARSHPVVGSGPELLDAAAAAAELLSPLYRCGSTADYRYHYCPEPVKGL